MLVGLGLPTFRPAGDVLYLAGLLSSTIQD